MKRFKYIDLDNGLKKFIGYHNNNIDVEIVYVLNGKWHGEYVYHSDGEIKRCQYYKNGEIEGERLEYSYIK